MYAVAVRPTLLALVGLAGCAAAPPPSVARVDSASLVAWACDDAADATPASIAVLRTRFETVRVAAAPARPTWPVARGPRIDVRFERARLGSALRLLADAADVGIVLGEGLEREISADLRRVRPLEAMHALAEAHHVELRIVGRTVIARRRNGT